MKKLKKRLISLSAVIISLAMVLPLFGSVLAVDTSYKSWSQGDSRWGSMSISSTGDGTWTMWQYGCYITAVAKLLVHAGQQDPATFTPKECLKGMLDHGMLNAAGDILYGNFNSSFLPTYGPELTKETSPTHGAWNKATAVSTISSYINNGYYIIVCVNNRNTGNTHYMAVDSVSDDVYVMDNGGITSIYGNWAYSGGIIDQVYFKYSGTESYPAVNGGEDKDEDPPEETKTQYRYHRYIDNKGEYAICPYYGNVTYNTTMHIEYTDWLDSPLPEVKRGYVNYLEHPYQGASCDRAGCIDGATFQVHRHEDSKGGIWYYEETRTVVVDEPSVSDPAPNCDNGHTWGVWSVVREASCGATGMRRRNCSICGETGNETIPATEHTWEGWKATKPAACETPGEETRICVNCGQKETRSVEALGHNYQVDGETDTVIYYVCANCGDNYTEEKKLSTVDKSGFGNFVVQSQYNSGLFADVDIKDWFSGNVATAYELGLMKGTGSGTFSPGNNVTLAETITLAARLHRIYHTGSDSFASYDGGNWYDPYVDYARENNIINTYYNYSRPATREEFVYILAKALPEEALENIAGSISFADNGDITYISEIRLLSGAGVINGIKENGEIYFKPLNTITRAEVAAVITRMAKPSLRKG